MEKREINVQGLPKGGPYSHAVEAGGFIFVSGMVPVDPEKGKPIQDDFEAASHLVLNNIKRILESEGSGLHNVVKVTIYLKRMSDFQNMNAIYGRFFAESKPARTTVPAPELPFPLEIEVVALK